MKNPLLTVLFILLLANFAHATHLRTGQINVRQDPNNNLTVWITIVVYTNTLNTNVQFGGEDDILDFGDGKTMLIPEIPNRPMPELGAGVAMASFTISHTYEKHGAYLISYSEPNRNEGVLNMDNSVSTRFYTETYISLKPGLLYRTPEFELAPVFTSVFQKQLTLSLACVDSMGNKLRYQLIAPKSSRDRQVANYRIPENCSMDYFSGVMLWDTKFQGSYLSGEYAFAIKVSQLDSESNLIGYMVSDFQIILTDSEAETNIAAIANEDENGRIYIPVNETDEIKILASASGANVRSIIVVSELLEIDNALTVQTYDSVSTNNVLFKVAKLSLKNIPGIVRDNPYSISIRVSFKAGVDIYTSDITYLLHTKEIQASPPGIVGTEELLTRDFEVYPNPFHEKLFVNIKNKKPSYIEIMDLNGKLVFRSISLPESIDMMGAETGTYLVVIKQEGKTSVEKMVKE